MTSSWNGVHREGRLLGIQRKKKKKEDRREDIDQFCTAKKVHVFRMTLTIKI